MKIIWAILVLLISTNIFAENVILRVQRSAVLMKFEGKPPAVGEIFNVIEPLRNETIAKVEIREVYNEKVLGTIREGVGQIKPGDHLILNASFDEQKDLADVEPNIIDEQELLINKEKEEKKDRGGGDSQSKVAKDSPVSHRFLFISPQLGYLKSMTNSQDMGLSGEGTASHAAYTGFSYGAQGGICFEGFLLGAQYMLTSTNTDYSYSNINFASSTDEEKHSVWGPFLGYRSRLGLLFYITYFMKAAIEDVVSQEQLQGTGYGFAVGYSRKYFSINFEVRSLDYTTLVDSSGETYPLPFGDKSDLYIGDRSSYDFAVNVGVPFDFFF